MTRAATQHQMPPRSAWRHLCLALTLSAAPAQAFDLAFPAACALGDTCYIQQYPDHDPGPGATDFTCGPLSYDGHDGTDIALPSRAAMATGVAVLAAAPGTVAGLRDGIADFAPFTPGRECGNGVLIQHEGGWQTQYCHMKQGSVAVTVGQPVQTGTKLGLIGQSGMADFPHVHLSVRHNGVSIDPFEPDATACNAPGPGLWSTPIAYEPGGLLTAGFSDQIPSYDAVKSGQITPTLPATAPALVLWSLLYGTRSGDILRFTITGPDGVIFDTTTTIDTAQAQSFRAMGKRLTLPSWPPGPYQGQITLTRNETQIDQIAATLTITP